MMRILFLLFILSGGSLMAKESLSVCPESPNCVCSFEEKGTKKYVAPFIYKKTKEEVIPYIVKQLTGKRRVTLIEQKENYLKYEFKTFLGFVDEVEFLVTDVVHFKSASKTGYYDFNKNYKRYLKIKDMLTDL